MIFKRFRQKPSGRHQRLRIESCVSIILDLNERLGDGKIKPEVIKQFERLKETLRFVTDDSVDESDIGRIEEATNQLLDEIRPVFEENRLRPLHEGHLH